MVTTVYFSGKINDANEAKWILYSLYSQVNATTNY
ncbi:hypothetical protein BH11BAC5_BH11BAC5_30910 [soil metagenome]|jgi:hypothetical protein